MVTVNSKKLPKRKSDFENNILMKYYHLYEGYWENDLYEQIEYECGYAFTKKQINKYFWDKKKKERKCIEAKKYTYPGLIF